jgi:hypothetical protein
MTPARAKSPTRPPACPSRFTGVKVFWASVYAHRARLGETVTEWLAAHPEIQLVDMVVTQSSDAHYHLVSISVFYLGELAAVEVGLDDARRDARDARFSPAREG